VAREKSAKALVITALAGVLGGVLVFAAISALVGSGTAKSKLGSDVFKVGKAKNQGQFIDRHGPLLFADPLQKGRDIYVVHLGDNKFAAFEVHPPGEPKSCTVKWDEKAKVFRDSCGDRTYPIDGSGLVRYNASVDKDGDLIVDLHKPLG
jgi:hypothetical protein